jgi:hypothetical protein
LARWIGDHWYYEPGDRVIYGKGVVVRWPDGRVDADPRENAEAVVVRRYYRGTIGHYVIRFADGAEQDVSYNFLEPAEPP